MYHTPWLYMYAFRAFRLVVFRSKRAKSKVKMQQTGIVEVWSTFFPPNNGNGDINIGYGYRKRNERKKKRIRTPDRLTFRFNVLVVFFCFYIVPFRRPEKGNSLYIMNIDGIFFSGRQRLRLIEIYFDKSTARGCC